jgi:hypothetical protein
VGDSLHEILRIRKLAFVEVHVPLSGRDIGVAQQSPGVFDSLLTADLRPAFVPGQVQNQIARQPRCVPQPGIRSAEIGNRPRLPGRREEETRIPIPVFAATIPE